MSRTTGRRTLTLVMAATVLGGVGASAASAATTTSGSVPATVTVNAGTLGFASLPAAISPPSVTLTGRNLMTGAFPVALDVSDATGSGNGWDISLNATPFTNSTHTLGSLFETSKGAAVCDASSTCTVATDASNGVSTPSAVAYGATQLVHRADTGSGLGNQSVSPTFDLAVPANTYAGIYSSTWTITIASAPTGTPSL